MPHACTPSVSVLIHPSQFPQAVEASLRESLRTREMNHKFHYDTPKQTLRWLRLHEALSPARTDPDCFRIYESAFVHCAAQLALAPIVEVVSLGCGGGQKDTQFLRRIAAVNPGVRLRYVPVDVSPGLALVARTSALEIGLAPEDIVPLVLDLAEVEDWAAALSTALGKSDRRIVCFFGMLPNFVPSSVLPQLASLIRPADLLILSANLAPGADYQAGVDRVLPLYDNELTRDWLWSVLLDLGMDKKDGRMDFSIAACQEGSGLLRIESVVTFVKAFQLRYGGSDYDFASGETFRLFFSYRHTPERLSALLRSHGTTVQEHWSNTSGDEGVFVCRSQSG